MFKWLVFPLFAAMLIGCDLNRPPQPPADSLLADNIAGLYLQAGPGIQVKDQRVLGKHYLPSDDRWRVVFCVSLILNPEQTVSDCNDSFQLFQLDSGMWIVGGTANGQYRWTEVTASPLRG